jgi:hypothetical protein
MNKGYLSKKSWHTGSLRHIEKVWKAEQRAEDEAKRIAELKKELEEERELQQLRQLHQQSSGGPRYVPFYNFSACFMEFYLPGTVTDHIFIFLTPLYFVNRGERLDWMYQDPMISSGPSSEDYLMGKAFKEKPEEAEINKVRTFHSKRHFPLRNLTCDEFSTGSKTARLVVDEYAAQP